MQIDQSILQSGFVLMPRHAIHSRGGLPLQSVKAVPQQINRYMVEQGSEPFLLPPLCCFSHTAPSLGHSFPALCRARVGPNDVLLGPPLPSPTSAEGSPSLFGWFIGTMRRSDSS